MANFTVLRLDGNNFSRYTKQGKFVKPFDKHFTEVMASTSKHLCEKIPHTSLAFSQSDEISVVLDHRSETAEPWFGGREAKLTSLSAAYASTYFSYCMEDLVVFDSRVLYFDRPLEVLDYLAKRQRSGRINAVSMIAGTLETHKNLMHMGTKDRLTLIESSTNKTLDDFPDDNTKGFVIKKGLMPFSGQITGTDGVTRQVETTRKFWVKRTFPDFADVSYNELTTPEHLDSVKDL